MPYASEAQRKYFNANRSKIGPKVVDEFNAASKGKTMPAKKKVSKKEIKSKVSAKLAGLMNKKY